MQEPRTLGSTHQDLSLFNLEGTRNAGSLPVQVRLGKPHTDLKCFTKIYVKLIIHLNVKYKNVKLLEHSIEENLDDSGFDRAFLDTIPKAGSMRESSELDFIKIENVCSAKDTV